jgi:hypothetical protein
MLWQKWFRAQRLGRINLKNIEIVLWDEFDLGGDMKLEMGHISALSRKSPQDKVGKKRLLPLKARLAPGKKGTN